MIKKNILISSKQDYHGGSWTWLNMLTKPTMCSDLIFSGGVMLVHDIRKNETRVIDFRETAPSGIHEEMLYTNLDLNVRHFFRCLILITVRC